MSELTKWMVREMYPRTVACVERFVLFEQFAAEVVQKSAAGQVEYKKILMEAFRRRHQNQKAKAS